MSFPFVFISVCHLLLKKSLEAELLDLNPQEKFSDMKTLKDVFIFMMTPKFRLWKMKVLILKRHIMFAKVSRLTRLYKKQSCTDGWYPYSACMHIKEPLGYRYGFLQPSDQTIVRTCRENVAHVTKTSQEWVILYGLPTVHI